MTVASAAGRSALDFLHAPLLLFTDDAANGTSGPEIDQSTDLTHRYFLALTIIVLWSRAVGTLMNKVGIPRVIGDIIAGCLLGPTIMGTTANEWLFPDINRPILEMFGQFGLIMTSMSAGFSFDRRVMNGRVGKICLYTFLNLFVPALIAIPLYYILPSNANWRGPSFDSAAYFFLLISAVGATAGPFVFLILDEIRCHNDASKFSIGMSCLSTIALFTLLSVVSVLSDPSLSQSLIIVRLLFLLLVFGGLLAIQFVWGHLLSRAVKGSMSFLRYGSDDMAILVIALGLLSAIASERLGYTFLLGAFLAGASMPFDLGIRSNLGEKIRWMTRWVFLPQFFVSVGLKFNLRELKAHSVPYVLLFLVIAFGAKALLVPISRFALRMQWREAAFCASLANCRGFNVLIVAQFGSQYNLIGPSFFIACILLSVLSTMVTGPLAKMFRDDDPPPTTTHTSNGAGANPHHTLRSPLSPSNQASDHGSTGNKQALSPRLLDAEGRPASTSMSDERKQAGADGSASSSSSDGVHIILPSDSASDAYESDAHHQAGGGVGGVGLHPSSESHELPTDREAFFSSWLSENYDSKSRVLVIFGDDLKARLRDPTCTLPSDSSSGEIRFRGDLFVDWLMQHFCIEHRAMAIVACQRLLENNIIAPVEVAVFMDKNILYTLG